MGAPTRSITFILPDNVGRNHHSFANYITTILPGLVSPADEDDSGSEVRKVDLKLMIHTALTNGFGCAFVPYHSTVSVYHDKTILSKFAMRNYTKGHQDYKIQQKHDAQFQSSYKNLGDFYTSLKARPSSEEEPSLVPVVSFVLLVVNIINSGHGKILTPDTICNYLCTVL